MSGKKLEQDLKHLFKQNITLRDKQVSEFVKTHCMQNEDFANLKKMSDVKLKNKKMFLKTKTWIENEEGELSFAKGKTELLEFIDESGSLLSAAKAMNLNYKKAWVHLRQIQSSSDEPLVISKRGKSKKSGSKLTPKAKELIIKFKILQQDIENFANLRFKQLFEE